MQVPPYIFCFPTGVQRLAKAFPESRVLAFAETTDHCRDMINALDNDQAQQAWLLFETKTGLQQNMPVRDHINLSGDNTLIGPEALNKGPRFPDLSSVYEDRDGLIVVLGSDPDLARFKEDWVAVSAGVWEAIALKHRGFSLRAWVVADLETWITEHK